MGEFTHSISPEDIFIVNPKVPHEINTEVLTTLVDNAESTTNMLLADGMDLDLGFTQNHRTIIKQLYSIKTNLVQIQQLVDHTNGGNNE